MKRDKIKRLVAGLCAMVVLAMGSTTALAADTVDVNGSGRASDTTKVVVGYQDKDLFSNMKDLMPGDVISNEIAVSNQSGRAVTIYLKAYSQFDSEDGLTAHRETSEASAEGKTFRGDILDQISMTLRMGDEILYRGSADGNDPEEGYEAMTAGDYGISLGSFAAGSQKALTVELTLPGPEFDNSFADKFDAVDWVFCVEGTTPSSGGGGGSSGGGPSGGGDPNGGPGVTLIEDSDVPLGPGESTNVVITDPETPLASIPKMGDAGVSGYVFGIALALLAASGAVYAKKRLASQ